MGRVTEDIDDRALLLAIKRRVKEVPNLVEEYLRTTQRDPVRITLDVPLTVVAAWSLTPRVGQAADCLTASTCEGYGFSHAGASCDDSGSCPCHA